MPFATIILVIIIIIANVTQDEIRFHWSRLFGHWFKDGSKLEQWFNPNKSWTNKYISSSRFLTFIFSTVLVWTTDFWHLLKGIIINSIIGIYCIVTGINDIVSTFLIINILWGIGYELFLGVYGVLSDRYIK